MARTVVALLIAASIGLGCAAITTTEPTAPTSVSLGGEAWTVLEGDADGMRGRADFGGADGMLFRFAPDVDTQRVAWVMDGVAFPLDIAWFDAGGALVGTASMATCPADPCPTYQADADYRFALEAPVGAFDDLKPTDRLVVEE